MNSVRADLLRQVEMAVLEVLPVELAEVLEVLVGLSRMDRRDLLRAVDLAGRKLGLAVCRVLAVLAR